METRASPQAAKNRDKIILEAARLVAPKEYQVFSEIPGAWDDLLLLAKQNREHAMAVMDEIGRFLRRGILSLGFWRGAKHVPEIQAEAQNLLADIVMQLQEQGGVKLAKSPESFGSAFAARWKVLRQDNSHRSNYAAIPVFAHHLYEVAECRFCCIGAINVTISDSKPCDAALLHLMNVASEKGASLSDEIAAEIADEVEHSMRRWTFGYFSRNPHTFDWMWKNVFWPLAKDIWPKWARGHEDFTGFEKVKFGAPLSQRKRAVDDKTDFGIAEFESPIKREVERFQMHQRSWEGDGGSYPSAKKSR